jgi:diaminopropionate ammonia-lyase
LIDFKMLLSNPYSFDVSANLFAKKGSPYGSEQASILNAEGFSHAKKIISAWPNYAETPLRNLQGLAKAAGVASVHYKDESTRFNLGSFKPLGGAYAVHQCLMSELAKINGDIEPAPADLLNGTYKETVSKITVTAATDGNHGRSVAWGAQLFGCRCVIFIHETVTPGRETAIASYGAEVRRNPGTYDDAVRTAQETAQENNWHVIPDTSDGKIIEAPRNVMQGYTLMAAEAIAQLPADVKPSHTFLQAGVGGMAAATAAEIWQAYQSDRPVTVLVEPKTAACWYESLMAGKPVVVGGELESIMAGLACGEISQLAWEILSPCTDAMIKIDDDAAADCMRLLADSRYEDAPFAAGESAVAGLAGFLAVASDENARTDLGLGPDSNVLLFGTEGATDLDTYAEIVGRPASVVNSTEVL